MAAFESLMRFSVAAIPPSFMRLRSRPASSMLLHAAKHSCTAAMPDKFKFLSMAAIFCWRADSNCRVACSSLRSCFIMSVCSRKRSMTSRLVSFSEPLIFLIAAAMPSSALRQPRNTCCLMKLSAFARLRLTRCKAFSLLALPPTSRRQPARAFIFSASSCCLKVFSKACSFCRRSLARSSAAFMRWASMARSPRPSTMERLQALQTTSLMASCEPVIARMPRAMPCFLISRVFLSSRKSSTQACKPMPRSAAPMPRIAISIAWHRADAARIRARSCCSATSLAIFVSATCARHSFRTVQRMATFSASFARFICFTAAIWTCLAWTSISRKCSLSRRAIRVCSLQTSMRSTNSCRFRRARASLRVACQYMNSSSKFSEPSFLPTHRNSAGAICLRHCSATASAFAAVLSDLDSSRSSHHCSQQKSTTSTMSLLAEPSTKLERKVFMVSLLLIVSPSMCRWALSLAVLAFQASRTLMAAATSCIKILPCSP
mmetsp:Transcript_48283/g.146858  ORF Transcript_48283/g.146858 Transcript_48283/m.146858 type:complete len:490 (-) Transcript_48283:654-2123(-)